MKGYLFNFYKFSPTVVDDNTDKIPDKFIRSIVWSSFDRLEIRPISRFEQYRLSGFSEKNWLGERQFAMVYELDDNYCNLVYNPSGDDECSFVFDVVTSEENKDLQMLRFFSITMIDFTPEVHNFFYNKENFSEKIYPGEKIHKTLRTAIDNIISNYDIKNNIAYEIYGVLGGQDIVIVWLANQFDDIAKIIETLRNSKTANGKAIIANVYTIVGLKDINNENIKYDDVNGKLNIKLTKKDSFNNKIFNEDIKNLFPNIKEEFDSSLIFGEHDLIFTLEGKNLIPELYKRNGLFNSKSPNFRLNFIQSKTEITIQNDIEINLSYTFPINVQNIDIKTLSNVKTTKYIEMIDKISSSSCFQNASYLQETLWLLYEDFLKNSMSSFSYPWISDLDYQFENCLNYLSIMVYSSMDNDKKYKNIHQLFSGMRQMMLHVAQANRIFFEIPNTHLKHTGAYSKILHTYYGIVKQYLKLVYSLPKYDNQTPIVPFISFDVTPIAKSRFCDSVEGFNNKIIKIEMPYEALINISKYMKLLAHEIYHYVAPVNRVDRNLLVGRLSLSIIIGQMGKIFIEKKIAKESFDNYSKETLTKEEFAVWDEKFNSIANLIRVNTLTIQDFENILEKSIPNYKDNAEWKEYFDKFNRAIINGLKGKSEISKLLYIMIQNLDEKNIGSDEIAKKIIRNAKRIKENDFFKWLNDTSPIQYIIPVDYDLRYSLREAMADYFMLQVTKMNVDEYIDLVYEYRGLVSKNPKHMKQNFRVTLIIYLYYGKEIKENITFQNKSTKEIISELTQWFKRRLNLKEEICFWLADEYVPFILGFGIYEEVFKQYFEQLNFNTLDNEIYRPEFSKQLEEIRSILNVEINNSQKIEEFDKNIQFIERLQNQDELRRLESTIKYYPPENRPKFNFKYTNKISFNEHYSKEDFLGLNKVNDLEGLIKALKNAIRDISDKNENAPIWFRGHTSKKYYLLPSIYRMLDQKSKFYDISMRDTLKSLTELFKAKAFNAPELIGDKDRAETNCLISMQHYSIPTNILDWSTSAFVAMYFALENEINTKEIKTEDNENAVIFLLNPIRLNIAREALKSSYAARGKETDLRFPILALSEDERFEDYLPSHTDNNKGKAVEYPLAVYAPFVNQRIKAQRGTFVMFGLDNLGVAIPEENARDYKEETLEKMQEAYKELCADEKKHMVYKQFLTYVEISKDAKNEIAMCLKELGIGKSNIYPELENISQELIKEVKAYFEAKK